MTDTKGRSPSRARWQATLPFLVIGLFFALIATLIGLTRSHDAETQRANLLNDALWIEQSLRFKLDRNAAQLTQAGLELGTQGLDAGTEGRLRQLLRADTSLTQVLWLDATGFPRAALPPVAEDFTLGDSDSEVSAAAIMRLASVLRRPAYGPTYELSSGIHQFDVFVPVFSTEGLLGTMVGIYSLPDLISRELPWWFSERYRVSVLDPQGREIAAKSRVAPLSGQLTYSVAFDPPGHGLLLNITAYRDEVRWIPLLLTASMVLLAGLIVLSVWQLRRQLVRRQAAEQALRGETQFRQAMENSLLTGLRARDMNGRITFVNPAFCRMVGYTPEELIGHEPPMPYWDPEHIERTREIHDLILAGEGPREGMELVFRHKDGHRLDAIVYEAPLVDASGQQSGWMGSVLDITEQKRVRELARQQDERLQATARLITMGEMASTLAHEINQPLAAIATYNSGCINRLSEARIDPEELRDIHEKLGRQARRAGEIVRRVHDFVRRSEPKREPVEINAIIRESIALLEADTRKRRVTVVAELAERMPIIEADPIMIEQVVVNLMRNAMDAMRQMPADRRVVMISTREESGHFVIRVTDHGEGISAEVAKRLFEPFFTTKQEGMGMGLNICRSIAELHRGRLGFESHPGRGTVFILTLPVEPS